MYLPVNVIEIDNIPGELSSKFDETETNWSLKLVLRSPLTIFARILFKTWELSMDVIMQSGRDRSYSHELPSLTTASIQEQCLTPNRKIYKF